MQRIASHWLEVHSLKVVSVDTTLLTLQHFVQYFVPCVSSVKSLNYVLVIISLIWKSWKKHVTHYGKIWSLLFVSLSNVFGIMEICQNYFLSICPL